MTIGSMDTHMQSGTSSGVTDDFETSLSKSESTINTGRYIITAVNDQNRDNSSGDHQSSGGDVKIFDTKTNTYLNVYGGSHLIDSDGDKAKFSSKALDLFLGDGTHVEFMPTSAQDGTPLMSSVIVSKNQQTAFINDTGDGQLSVSNIRNGNVFFTDPRCNGADVMHVNAGVSLAHLLFLDDASQLKCKRVELNIDSKVPDWFDFSTKLSVSNGSIDTGRYLLTASRNYTRDQSYGGGTASDGQVEVYDKETDTYVDIFGDPHLADSAGDKAHFGSTPLELLLDDGTQVEFMPTALHNGVADIDSVAVTKRDQTSFITGVSSGTLDVSQVEDGLARELRSQYHAQPVAYLASRGSLSNLRTATGPQLDGGKSDLNLDENVTTNSPNTLNLNSIEAAGKNDVQSRRFWEDQLQQEMIIDQMAFSSSLKFL